MATMKQTKIALPSAHSSTVTAKGHTANAPSTGGAVKGFGGGKPAASTVNGVGGPVAKAPQTKGGQVRGFSGGGIKAGKV
jgi:hypothetical protein